MRYGLYYAPAEGSAFWQLGSAWLGRDAASGRAVAQPDVPGIAERTAAPRRYGLHATLKAPFALAEGVTEAAFLAAVEAWAADQTPFALPPLAVGCLGDFVALRPTAACPALEAVAAACVRDLDRFRRPPTTPELARRNPDALDARERGYLDAWGYPYVLDAYRFHITLSDSIADATERNAFAATAATWMAAADLSAEAVSEVCVFAETVAGEPFIIMRRFKFSA